MYFGCGHLKVCLFSPKMYEFHFFFLLSILKVKSKTSSSSSKTTTTTKTKVREKKVYTLPGEKHDPPEEVVLIQSQICAFSQKHVSNNWCYQWFFWQREPLRIFYESLWKQIPTSEMAEFWWGFLLLIILAYYLTLWRAQEMKICNSGIWNLFNCSSRRSWRSTSFLCCTCLRFYMLERVPPWLTM